VNQKIKEFVNWVNANSESPLSEHKIPIVAFQFVSLNKANDGKMVWWEYVHKGADAFNNAVTELITDKATGNTIITKTLINWEYKKNVFWYEKLGNGNIIENIPDNFSDNFNEVKDRVDNTGVEREQCSDEDKCALLLEWEDILRRKLECKGSSMWVSIPHKEIDRNTTIYSSIFCVFNKHLQHDVRIRMYRIFRDFIINYLIEINRESKKSAINQELQQKTTENIADYKPKYQFSSPQKPRQSTFSIKRHFDGLCTKFFQDSYLSDFINIKNTAIDIICKATIENKKLKYNYSDGNPFSNIVFPEPKNIKEDTKDFIIRHTFGRYLMLGFCLVLGKTVRDAYGLIAQNNADKDTIQFKQINQYFKISGFKDCRLIVAGDNGLQISKILPYLSKKEIEFLKSCATTLSKSNLLNQLTAY
jgi:hypothetical protein